MKVHTRFKKTLRGLVAAHFYQLATIKNICLYLTLSFVLFLAII